MEKYIPSEIPEYIEIVYLKAVKDPKWLDNVPHTVLPPTNFKKGSVTWTTSEDSVRYGFSIIENNAHLINYDKTCFVEITKEEYYNNLGKKPPTDRKTKLLLI